MDLSEHGVFAAGLINAVAGADEIDLYQVLNAAGCGDLATLNKALNEYRSTMQSKHEGGLQGVIISLSLGVLQPENPETKGLPVDIYTLQQTLYDFTQEGAVIVAAAGNNSAGLPAPRTSDLPAAYPYVIGVAATNIEDQRACYSNLGHIAAPGGDGGSFDGTWPDNPEVAKALNTAYSGKTCLPVAFTCQPDDPNCYYGLVSYSPGSATRYRFWSGSSFAAPLVSGIAVRLLDMGHQSVDITRVVKEWVAGSSLAPNRAPNVIPPIDTLPAPTPTP
jgi:subtilase family serine protease